MTSSEYSRQITQRLQDNPLQRQQEYEKVRGDLGVGDIQKSLQDARKSVYDTDRLISGLPTNIARRTGGRLMTQAQRDRLLASERNPLANQLQSFSRAEQVAGSGLDMANQELATRMGLFERGQGDMLSELLRQRQMAFENESRERDQAFQRSIANSNRQMYDLSFLQDMFGEQNRALSAPVMDMVNRAKGLVESARNRQPVTRSPLSALSSGINKLLGR